MNLYNRSDPFCKKEHPLTRGEQTERSLDGYVSCGEISPIKVQVLDLARVLVFFKIYFRLFGDICSIGEDVSINYGGACGDFANLKMLWVRLCVFILYSDECLYVYMGIAYVFATC